MFHRLTALLVIVAAFAVAQPRAFDCSVIPASQKPPFIEAPSECGGGCYWVGPFNPRPWASRCTEGPKTQNPPVDFVAVYGNPPKAGDFANYQDFQVARDKYSQDLRYFKGIHFPEGLTANDIAASVTYITSYGMGRPVVFEGRYGFMVRFKGIPLPDFELPFVTLKDSPGNVVSTYQMSLFYAGMPVPCSNKHDWTPPAFCQGGN